MIEIREADLSHSADAEALVEIVDAYARGPSGQNAPLAAAARAALPKGLREHPAAFALLAFDAGRPVGAAVCFFGFSTFAGKPLLNIHDLAVLASHRGRGIGGRLLAEVERRASARGCCKITLEVLDSNAGARRLYERSGFGPAEAPPRFLAKRLEGGESR
ncbi:MAG: GNAT family N-acetyltransferase [Myxococcota bacterium]